MRLNDTHFSARKYAWSEKAALFGMIQLGSKLNSLIKRESAKFRLGLTYP